MNKRIILLWINCIVFIFIQVYSLRAQSESDNLKQSLSHEHDTIKVVQLLRMAWHHRFSNPDSAYHYVRKADELETDYYLDGVIYRYNTLGVIAWSLSDYGEALTQFKTLLELTIELKDSARMSKALNNVGSTYFRMGKLQEAADHYFQGLRIKEKIKAEPKSIAMAYNNLGSIYYEMGDQEYAEMYLKESLEIRQAINDSLGIADTYHNLARIHREKKDFRLSKQYFLTASVIKEKMNDFRGLASTLTSLAVLYEVQELYDSAKYYHAKSIASAKKSSSSYELLRSRISKADLHLKIGEIDDAYQNIQSLGNELDNISSLSLIADANLVKSNVFKATGQYDSALFYYKEYVTIRDSSINKENTQHINTLKWEYETEKKELQLASEKRKKLFGYILVGALIIILSLAINRLFAQRKINKISKEKYESEVDYKNRQLASRTIDLANYNKVLESISDKIAGVEKDNPEDLARILKKTIKQKQRDISDWEQVKLHFEEVHPSFFEKINELTPPLTSNEQKHCAYIKMKISNKDIARMLNVNLSSVHVVHHRLKKKLGLVEDDSLTQYINSI